VVDVRPRPWSHRLGKTHLVARQAEIISRFEKLCKAQFSPPLGGEACEVGVDRVRVEHPLVEKPVRAES